MILDKNLKIFLLTKLWYKYLSRILNKNFNSSFKSPYQEWKLLMSYHLNILKMRALENLPKLSSPNFEFHLDKLRLEIAWNYTWMRKTKKKIEAYVWHALSCRSRRYMDMNLKFESYMCAYFIHDSWVLNKKQSNYILLLIIEGKQ